MAAQEQSDDIEITGEITSEFAEILTPEAVEFIADLERKFGSKVDELLGERAKFQNELRAGKKLDFLPETKEIRDGDWKIAPIPQDLQDRRVEITGPVDRKMMINALNSGAKVFMADFEDSLTPGWNQVIQGHINLRDAIAGNIEYTSPEGKEYKLKGTYPSKDLAIMIIRPRGWHLPEKHFSVDGKAIHGAFLDFGLYFFHNVKNLISKGTGPYFYLPKLETYKEAEIWADIFSYVEEKLAVDHGTIKATVLIETITAAFQMDEILYALKDYIVAQNAGRWDYIFSYIKKHSHDPSFICPDRHKVIMTQPFLRAYSLLLIKTCHKRGAFAMGGMAAFIPVKNDEAANEKAFAMVKKDKEREAGDGHDGTWVAHPGLIPVAMEAFDRLMPTPNQVDKLRDDVEVTATDLLEVPGGAITEAGVRNNISVSLQYLASWLNGNGCVPIFNLMEDAATAEIARTQLWQWIHHPAKLDDGTEITRELFEQYRDEELAKIKESYGDAYDEAKFAEALEILEDLVDEDLDEFLTTDAYDRVS